MPLISKPIPNLIGGVSQQPDAIRFDNQCEQQDNAYPSVLEGLTKRQHSEHVAKAINGAPGADEDYFVHYINRDPVERYSVIIEADESAASLVVQPLDGSAAPTVIAPDGLDYLLVPSGYSSSTSLRAVTIADYTFILNRTTVVDMNTATRDSRRPEALIYVKKGDYGTKYQVLVNGTGESGDNDLAYTITTVDGSGSADRDFIDTVYISDQIKTGLEADDTNNVFDISTPTSSAGTVIWVRRTSSTSFTDADFDIEGYDGLGNTSIVVVKDQVEKLTDLPTVAPHGFTVKVLGSAEDERDDYWVRFVANDEGFSNGYWEETGAPGVTYQLDETTLPHVLIRQADGSFRFTPADGATYTVDSVDYTVPSWGQRDAGDDVTNADPTFVGRNINDMFLFKNRLGFLSDENVILSETAEFFNFFRTSVLSLLDSDPIDVASTDSRVSILTAAVPFARQLVLFSEQSQFLLQSGNDPLTPNTVSMTRTTSYESLSVIRPLSLGNSIYFGFTRGDYTGLRQYFLTSDTETIFDAIDISSQVPQYILGQLRDITGSSHEDIAALLTDSTRNTLYIYKFFDQQRERVQSAWSRFVFPDNMSILGIEFIDTTLYMTVSREDGVYIEKIRMESGLVDAGKTYRTLLDRRVDQSDCTLSVDGKTITLPYKVYDGSAMQVVTKDGVIIPVVTQTDNSTDLVVNTDLTSTDFWVGEKYTMTYKFSDQVLREATTTGGSATISEGRLQIRYLRVDYADTGYFKVSVTPDYRATSEHVMTAKLLGSGANIIGQVALESGTFRVPVYAKNDLTSIVVTSDAPVPCALTSAEFEMSFNPRSQRYA